MDRAIKVCKRVVSAFSYIWKKKRQLKKVQTDLDLPTHSLITSCDTRSGSTQKMITRFFEQENAIKQVLLLDRKGSSLQPSWQDLNVVEAVNKAVEPIIYFTDALSGENHVNISMMMPVLQLLNDDILAPKPDDVALTIEIKSKILNYLNDKYSDEKSTTRSLLDIASFLDPWFKNKFLYSAEDESTQIKISGELIE
ncbi:hypothetical protein SNE40_009557 [Patella caerulea]|uniref:Uncharacterized protein n=1 Tax=Patella caerulea TaxID=87958 RepID=A0AAN8Q3F7_PATCE